MQLLRMPGFGCNLGFLLHSDPSLIYGLVLDANLKEEESLASPLCGAPSAAPTQFVQSIIDANGDFAGAQPSSCETSCRSLLFMFG
jgi:hypothetical protein